MYIANTGVRTGSAGALAVLAVAAVTSVGWMAIVNFMIRSDFRWALLGLAGLWVLGLFLAAAAS